MNICFFRCIFSLPLLLILGVLTGCTSKPSLYDIEQQVIKHALQGGGDTIFTIENFKKTNGFQKANNVYIADVQYDLVFKKGIKELTDELKAKSRESMLDAVDSGMDVIALKVQYGHFSAGDRVVKTAKITFLKTEKGWLMEESA